MGKNCTIYFLIKTLNLHNTCIKIKSNFSFYSLYHAEACKEFAGPISASVRPCNTAPFEVMSQRWQAIGNTVSDLTGTRFEVRTSRSRDESVTARPTGLFRKSSVGARSLWYGDVKNDFFQMHGTKNDFLIAMHFQSRIFRKLHQLES